MAVFPLKHPGVNDGTLAEIVAKIPPFTFLVLEDVDVYFDATRNPNPPLTRQSLQNLLSGPLEREGLVVFMTANKPEVLDEPLTRPGRVVKIFFGNPSVAEAQAMFGFFFSRILAHAFDACSAEFEDSFKATNGLSLSALEQHFDKYLTIMGQPTATEADCLACARELIGTLGTAHNSFTAESVSSLSPSDETQSAESDDHEFVDGTAAQVLQDIVDSCPSVQQDEALLTTIKEAMLVNQVDVKVREIDAKCTRGSCMC